MRKVILYIAASVDGFISGPKGEIDWLHSIDNPENDNFGYTKFYKSIDTTIIGNSTYKQILSFGVDFPYSDKTNYVFTRNNTERNTDFVKFVNKDFQKFISNLKKSPGKNIWLIGGGKINSFFLKNNFIDEIVLTVLPIILGRGIPLFNNSAYADNLLLYKVYRWDCGVVQLNYNFRVNNIIA